MRCAERMNADQSSCTCSLTLSVLLATGTLAKQQTRKATINAGTESAGNEALTLMASLCAKITFIYHKTNLIVLLKRRQVARVQKFVTFVMCNASQG